MPKPIHNQQSPAYNQRMKPISACLKNTPIHALQGKLMKASSRLNRFEQVIRDALPPSCEAPFTIIRFNAHQLTIETSSVWLVWLKSHEQTILQALRLHCDINQIKWRMRTNTVSTQVASKNTMQLSPSSQHIIQRTATSIKHSGLKAALEKLAKSTTK